MIDIPTGQNEHLSSIDMRYRHGRNNYEIGKHRKEFSTIVAGRFSMISPVLIKPIYGISHRAALAHLNDLVDLGYLAMFQTHRSIDNRLYVLTRDGANYASELIQYPVPFRSQAEPSRQVNHNNIAHDLMNAYVLLRGVNNFDKNHEYRPMWSGFITEKEFARLYPSNDFRNVDGLVRENGNELSFAAIEIENSFKNKALRRTILEKYAFSLRNEVYEKVFFFSQQRRIFDDAKRFHAEIFESAKDSNSRFKQSSSLVLSDIDRLEQSLVFRTVMCDELQSVFYP